LGGKKGGGRKEKRLASIIENCTGFAQDKNEKKGGHTKERKTNPGGGGSPVGRVFAGDRAQAEKGKEKMVSVWQPRGGRLKAKKKKGKKKKKLREEEQERERPRGWGENKGEHQKRQNTLF